MGRAHVNVRSAETRDIGVLVHLWDGLLRPATAEADLAELLDPQADTSQRSVLVAEIDGEVVGATVLEVGAISPVNPDRFVHAFAPQVLPWARRRGVGAALMEAAVTFAEERGVPAIGTATLPGARDANRFFARLGLGPGALLRLASTATVRQRLGSTRPARAIDRRHVDRVLAARRGRRDARASASA